MSYAMVKINEGAKVSQDISFGAWPRCKPPLSEYIDEEYRCITKYPDAIFYAEKIRDKLKAISWHCTKEGYGGKEEYGNGCLIVWGENAVTMLSPLFASIEACDVYIKKVEG